MNAELVLLAIAALALWVGFLYVAPFSRCGKCKGTGHEAADSAGGEGTGDALLDRNAARRVPRLVRWAQRASRAVDCDGGDGDTPRRGAGAPVARPQPGCAHGLRPPLGRGVRAPGAPQVMVEGDTKSGKPRVLDLDAATVAVLRNHRRDRGTTALQLARDDALVFADHEGRPLHPDGMSRRFKADVARCRKAGVDVPRIRLHDLRHTHATLLLSAREPVHVVSRRLGHASSAITMAVYAHVLPGSQREAADLFASLIAEAKPS